MRWTSRNGQWWLFTSFPHFKLSFKVNRLLSVVYLEVIRLTKKHMCDIIILIFFDCIQENKRNQSIIKYITLALAHWMMMMYYYLRRRFLSKKQKINYSLVILRIIKKNNRRKNKSIIYSIVYQFQM